MSVFKTIAMAGALALTTAVSAGAATLNYATTIDAKRGTIAAVIADGRENADNALGAPDSNFYAMGFGGIAVLGFGTKFANAATVYEVTFNQGYDNGHLEAVDVYVGSSYGTGSFNISSFTLVGQINNSLAQDGQTLSFSGGPFTYLALVDVTKNLFPVTQLSSRDGFDLNAVGVSPVPLPAGGLLLLTAIGGLAAARRRKAA
jgi:hypothetical protein